jgi:LysM repeat protein
MKTKRAYLIAAIALLMMVLLVSCTRSVRTGGATPVPQEPNETIPPDATDVLSQIYIFATQTAQAAAGTAPAVPTTQTTPASPAPTTAPTQAPAPAATQPPESAPQQPVSPAVVVTAPPLVVPGSYSLQKGEFPFCIARRFNVDPAELLRVNGLSSYSVYYAGMDLRIPQTGRAFPGNRALMAHPTSYSVRAGDTLHMIACEFGDVDPNAIAVVNNLTPPYRLQPGQVLQIP